MARRAFPPSLPARRLPLCGLLPLQLQQRPFPLYAPPLASHLSISSDHTVAGNRHRDRISCAGACNRSCGRWLPDGLRDLLVRLRRSEGEALQV